MTKASTTSRPRGFAAYWKYVAELKGLARNSQRSGEWEKQAFAALNGQASQRLQKIIALKTRRRVGAFFTGSNLAALLIKRCAKLNSHSVVHDPSMGMGDLLLAVAKKLPLGSTFNKTLKKWGKQLTGTDIHAEFVEGAKTRLVILAQQRHGLKSPGVTSVKGLFPGIRVADGLTQKQAFKQATNLTLNPPFVLTAAPDGCEWAGGRITAAANFVVTALEHAKPGAELVAILPDVLRSGSFSKQWRKKIEDLAVVRRVEPYGVFDESADVDVFLLRVTRRKQNSKAKSVPWMTVSEQVGTTVGDFFDVHVGRVVPHRDPKKGDRHPYIHARCIPMWKTIRKFEEFRRHKGLVYKPPFVVIRRTSRPGHPYRAAATVIAGELPVAVENHLIVCEPKDRKFGTAKMLMKKLMSKKINKHLDERIRCRHLTVGAVSGIPFSPNY